MSHLEKSARNAVDDIKLIGGTGSSGDKNRAESDVVFNWCMDAVDSMMHVMSVGCQKKLARKVKDTLIVSKNL